jgi:hypothetical protein
MVIYNNYMYVTYTHDPKEAAGSPDPYRKEKAEVKYAGFDDVFALYPVNVSQTLFVLYIYIYILVYI